jgi:GDPmannose 4,6-dehydratase
LERSFGLLDLDWHKYVEHDPRYERPAEVDLLLGDASHAKQDLGWQPRVGFENLVGMMIASDLQLAEQERAVLDVRRRQNGG